MKKYEVLWYSTGDVIHTREFSTRQASLNFYNKIKSNPEYYQFWVTKRNRDWEVVEDIII